MSVAVAVVVVFIWLAILFRRGVPWRLRPRETDLPLAPPPARWPAVRVVVPARNEAESLPATLPTLLSQNYGGDFEVVVVDDRSSDGTAGVAAGIARACGQTHRLQVVRGEALPAGWVGKPWALAQGVQVTGGLAPDWLLFTDADIAHAGHSLATLVAESMHDSLVLNSRMARLRCRSAAERLLVPAYLYFFNLLYPMPRANNPRDRLAAAAGGCVLVDAKALHDSGGVQGIGTRIIDDIALAELLKRDGRRIRLALADDSVRSLRAYDDGDADAWRGDIWRMVRRSAFTQLRHSWTMLVLTLLMLVCVFLLPVLMLPAAAMAWLAGDPPAAVPMGAAGLFACVAMAASYLPVLRYFSLPAWRVLTLPWAALLFGCMTLDSGLTARRGRASGWR